MLDTHGTFRPSGSLALEVMRPPITVVPASELSFDEILKFGTPRPGLSDDANAWRLKNAPNLWRGFRKVMAARAIKAPHFYGQLSIVVGRCKCGDPDRHIKLALEGGDPRCPEAEWTDLGLASLRVVTTAGVEFIVDAFQDSVELEILKYHGIGTGVVAEAVGDTALGTELTTEYSTDNTRATGSLTEGGSANIYRTVGTNSVDATVAVTEHGILSQAAVGGGTLLDRSKFTAVNLTSGDSLQTTYDLTVSAGS